MSDLMFSDDDEMHRAQQRRMREDYANWQRRPAVSWFVVASVLGVIGLAALCVWVSR